MKEVTAAELMALLASDASYQDAERRREAERRARREELDKAEAPLVHALLEQGLEVTSVWDLVNTTRDYTKVLPLLLEHLATGGYPDRIVEGIGRALAVPEAFRYWPEIRDLYLGTTNPGAQDGLAVALSAIATTAQFDDLVQLITVVPSRTSGGYFLRPIVELGGSRGRDVVKSLTKDPVLGNAARSLLSKRGKDGDVDPRP